MPLVNWKQDRAKVVPKNTTKGKKVKSRETVIFIPGYNEVDEKDWKAIEKNCGPRLKDGNLELVTTQVKGKDGKEQEKPVSFAQIAESDPERARQIIAATYSEKLLTKWRKNSGKDELRTAISNQIDDIRNYTGGIKKRKAGIGK